MKKMFAKEITHKFGVLGGMKNQDGDMDVAILQINKICIVQGIVVKKQHYLKKYFYNLKYKIKK